MFRNFQFVIAMGFVSLVIAACATKGEVVVGPDGSPHRIVECWDIKACYREATTVCLGNYKIVNTSNQVFTTADSASSMTTLLIKCDKDATVTAPAVVAPVAPTEPVTPPPAPEAKSKKKK